MEPRSISSADHSVAQDHRKRLLRQANPRPPDRATGAERRRPSRCFPGRHRRFPERRLPQYTRTTLPVGACASAS